VLNSTNALAATGIGTPHYLSPEICLSKPYNAKSDVWSAGCVLYEMLCGTHAFRGANLRDIIGQIVRGSYPRLPSRCSAGARDLVASMLQTDPRRRPSMHQLLHQPVLRDRIHKFLSATGIQREMAQSVIHGRPAPGALLVQPAPLLSQAEDAADVAALPLVPASHSPDQAEGTTCHLHVLCLCVLATWGATESAAGHLRSMLPYEMRFETPCLHVAQEHGQMQHGSVCNSCSASKLGLLHSGIACSKINLHLLALLCRQHAPILPELESQMQKRSGTRSWCEPQFQRTQACEHEAPAIWKKCEDTGCVLAFHLIRPCSRPPLCIFAGSAAIVRGRRASSPQKKRS
jgi:Protein kinase domain